MTIKLGNNIIKLKRKLGIKGVYYEQRRNTKKSREENRQGDELEKAKKETALNIGIVFGISRFLLLKNKYSLIWVFICLVGFFMLFCGVYGYAG